jgi:uncharacterized protein (DUF2147 family)
MKRSITFLCAFLSLGSLPLFAADTGDGILGNWLGETKSATIAVYKAGDLFEGKINWLAEPTRKDGSPTVDEYNPDPAKRTQPVMGLVILKNFTYCGKNVWTDGKIYDPKNGKTYSCRMTLINDSTLHIRGYIGVTWLGRTTIWTRPVKPADPAKG